MSWLRTGKPSVIAAVNGAIAGLAGITPASGFVSVEHSFVIGIAIGFASYTGVILFKEKLKIDDALDVSSVHGVAGIIGSLSIGLFASKLVNPAGVDGLFFGNPAQLGIQAIAVGVASALGFCGTWVIMKFLDLTIGVRVSPEVEDIGLDISEHAERAYADEEEFKLDMQTYVENLEKKDKFYFNK
jgi:Amt family ammonium transporter